MTDSIIKDNVKHLKFYELVSRYLGIGLFILSTVYTVQLMQSFGQAGIQKVLFTVFGFLMQGSQLVCLAVGFLLTYTGNRKKATYFFIAFGVLMALSFIGTIGFFSVNQAKNTKSAFSTDKKYSEMQSQLKAYDEQIAETNKQISTMASKGLMSKGVAPARERLDRLQSKREALAGEITNYKPQAVSDSLYVSLSEFFDCDADSIKFGMNVVYAVLLDILSGLFVWFSLFLRYEIIPKHEKSSGTEDYTKEESIKPYDTKEQHEKTLYIPNPANAVMNLKETPDKDIQIQYLMQEIQKLKNRQDDTNTVYKKPILNQAESLDSVNADSPLILIQDMILILILILIQGLVWIL